MSSLPPTYQESVSSEQHSTSESTEKNPRPGEGQGSNYPHGLASGALYVQPGQPIFMQNGQQPQYYAVPTEQQAILPANQSIAYISMVAPVQMFCPYDNQMVTTVIKKRAGRFAYGASLLLCLFCFPCVCLPFCFDGCLDTKHVCPICQNTLATVSD